MINILLRTLATSGRALAIPKSNPQACGGFADDIALLQGTAGDTIATLNGPVRRFCDWSGMEVNTDKSIVTAIDYSTGKDLPTNMIHYGEKRLQSVKANEATKYLGVHVSLTLQWVTEKAYVMRKTLEAVRHLQHTALRRDQLEMLLRVCIEPLFRYSAPLIPWTEKELSEIDKLWGRVTRASLQLMKCTDTAVVLLPPNAGAWA